jgi:hypothetical protein
MSRILCVWELGAGYGHLSRFLPVALKLRERGHEVVFALRDLSRAEMFLGRHGFAFLQAPVWLPENVGLQLPANYAEMLSSFGFLDQVGLAGMVKAWRQLYQVTEPDLLLIDHGPTALLAARGTRIRRALIGSGFGSPPRMSPMPPLRPWLKVPEERLIESEQRVLATANSVLGGLGVEPLQTLTGLFEVEEDFLCTFSELDHYPQRHGARYRGPIFASDEGVAPAWPSGASERIFAYLHPRYRDFEKVVEQLKALPYRTLMHAPGLSDKQIKKYQAQNLAFSPEPVRVTEASRECDLVICHGGPSTVAASLLAGRPVLVLHLQLEQLLLANNVVRLGLGKTVNPDSKTPNYRQLIRDMLADSGFAERARQFAAKYADFSLLKQLDVIVTRCEEIIAGRPTSPS